MGRDRDGQRTGAMWEWWSPQPAASVSPAAPVATSTSPAPPVASGYSTLKETMVSMIVSADVEGLEAVLRDEPRVSEVINEGEECPLLLEVLVRQIEWDARKKMACMLVEAGAKVNSIVITGPYMGDSLLNYLIIKFFLQERGSIDSVKLLLELGADGDFAGKKLNIEGSLLDAVACWPRVRDEGARRKVIELLKHYGGTSYGMRTNIETVLRLEQSVPPAQPAASEPFAIVESLHEGVRRAIEENNLERLEAELRREEVLRVINTCDEYGELPLLLAAWRGTCDHIRMLIEKGADVNASGILGGKGGPTTPLLCAIRRAAWLGNSTKIELLIKLGASVHIAGDCFIQGLSFLPLEWVMRYADTFRCEETRSRIIELLEESGASLDEEEKVAEEVTGGGGLEQGAESGDSSSGEVSSRAMLDDSDDKASSHDTVLKFQEVSDLSTLSESVRSNSDPIEELKQFLMEEEGLSEKEAEEILGIVRPPSLSEDAEDAEDDEEVRMESEIRVVEMDEWEEWDELLEFLPRTLIVPPEDVNIEKETGKSLLWGGASDLAIGGCSFAAVLAVGMALVGAKGNVEGLLGAGVEAMVGDLSS